MSKEEKISWLKRFFLTRWLELQCLFRPAPWRRGSVFHSLAQHPGVWIPLLGLHLIVIWWIGRNFGVPLLFWHHQWNIALVSGVVVSLTIAFFLFVFFVLDYSAWFKETRKVRTWHRGSKADGTEPRLSELPIPAHWTAALSDHFDQYFGVRAIPRRIRERSGQGEPERRQFELELQHQSFLFRCLTNAFAYLITAIFLVRLAIYALRPFWRPENPTVSHGKFDIWNESVRFHDQSWWLFVGGMALGAVVVLLIDQVKFWVVPRLQKVAIGDPIPFFHRFDRRLVWSKEIAMMVLGLWTILILVIAQILIQTAGELGARYYAAPAVCIMLAWIVLLYGLVVLQVRRPLCAAWVVLILVILGAGTLPFLESRYGFAHLEQSFQEKHRLSTVRSIFPRTNIDHPPPEEQLATAEAAQEQMQQRIAEGRLFAGSYAVAPWKDGPLVVICASGGGITAEVWSIEVLTMLDRLFPDLAGNVRLVTGASGGMVGAAAWVGSKSREPADALWTSPLPERCYRDQLSPVALRLALFDFGPHGFVLQQCVPRMRHWNRGEVLEQIWTERHPNSNKSWVLPELGKTLANLASEEHGGTVPSLLFSPTIAEQGRPLLISNLDVSQIVTVGLPGANPDRWDRVHRAVDARNLLGGSAVESAPLSTWARMSATFPLVSPAGSIPFLRDPEESEGSSETGRIHIVDAGYTDNQGTSLALAWLRNYWLRWARQDPENAPRDVVLIEIDAFPRYGSRAWSDLPNPVPHLEGLRVALEDLRVPVVGLGNRMKSHIFHTDRMLEEFGDEVSRAEGLSFTSYRFINPIPASLSWFLSPQEKDGLKWFSALFQELARPESPAPLSDQGRRNVELILRACNQADTKPPVSIGFEVKRIQRPGQEAEFVAVPPKPNEAEKTETSGSGRDPDSPPDTDPFLSYSLKEFQELVRYWNSQPWNR